MPRSRCSGRSWPGCWWPAARPARRRAQIQKAELETSDLAFLDRSLDALNGGLAQVEHGARHRDLPVEERERLLTLGQQTLELVQHLKLQLEQADLERPAAEAIHV